ncbi:MAG: ParB/RepB/Spo0J family partition protein [Clostridia bacterium]|nr:ParB/RepB/Spo0J family partition protein [Clostridia bacterium]
MVKKTGLGKGLDALFSMPIVDEEIQKEGDILKNLKINEVEPNREQPRKTFDQESLEELSASIKQYGVIQPIVVTKQDGYYAIVAGERRWRASKMAGLEEIPAIIRDYDERTNREISLIENIQREDLTPYEKAVGIKTLMEEYDLTQEQVGKIIGRSRSAVANCIRILNLDPRVLEFAKQGKLAEGHCKALMALTDPEDQYQTAIAMVEGNKTVKEVEDRAYRKKKYPKVDKRYEPIYRDIEDTFQGFFGTKVKVDAGKRAGKIVIQYSSNSDLERILGLLK